MISVKLSNLNNNNWKEYKIERFLSKLIFNRKTLTFFEKINTQTKRI